MPAVVLSALLTPSAAGAALRPEGARAGEVRRVLTLLDAVAEEYREGVADSVVVLPAEYEAARLFLDESEQRLQGVPGLDATLLAPAFAALRAALAEKAPLTHVRDAVARLRAAISTATGISQEVFPAAPPSASRGRVLFCEHCVSCHGERADGQGPDATRLKPRPADFTSPQFMRAQTPYDFFQVISAGKGTSAMPAWGEVLSLQERWDLVSYLWTVQPGPPGLAEGQGTYATHCAGCHGAAGDGQGTYGSSLLRPAQPFNTPQALARMSDGELFKVVTQGVPGTPMPAFARTLSDEEIWAAVSFVRLLSLGGDDGSGATAASTGALADGLSETQRLLQAALAAYRGGDPRAPHLVSDAYFQFERMEKPLALAAHGIARRVEGRFAELRSALAVPGGADRAAQVVAAIESDLEAARRALQPPGSPYALALQSGTIILREGFEVVLIVGALLAYVVKSGSPHMKRPILWGTGTGVAMSLFTASLFAGLLHATGVSVEALEGATMLLAAVVLFSVSYWLISKAEAERWQRYIRGKVQTALARGSGLALAGAAFLAVYREGVETVLFFQALIASAATDLRAVTGGFAVGAIALALLCVGFVRFGLRIPLRQFFLGTSGLLYYLAIVFAGKGVAELQEGGWIGVTPVAGIPRLDLLGLYPTVETLLAQSLLLGSLAYALVVTVRGRTAAPAAPEKLLGEVGPMEANGR